MGYILQSTTADLFDEFLAAEKPRVSTQGFVKLHDMTRRVLAWFEEEELEFHEVGIQEALRYQAWLSERTTTAGTLITTGTMRNYLKVARRLFDHLQRTERVKTNPFTELRPPRLSDHLSRNVLTEAEMGRLLRELGKFDELSGMRERLRRYRVHVIAEFLYATGLRIAEACSLESGNLDLMRRLVYLREGKGGRPRIAFLTRYAAEVLRVYLERGQALVLGERGKKEGMRLFGAAKERVAAVVNAELTLVAAALEVPAITSHGFRHSLGTHLLRSGCDMRHIQVILGHEALQTTQVYTRVDKEDLLRSLDAHHPRHWARPTSP